MLGKDGRALEYASAEVKGDREFVLKAVARNRMALKHAALELKDDREVVLAAVAKHARALAWASAGLQSDPEVVLAALAHNRMAMEYASVGLLADRDFMIAAVERSGWALAWASPAVQEDREVVLAAVAQAEGAICHAQLPELCRREAAYRESLLAEVGRARAPRLHPLQSIEFIAEIDGRVVDMRMAPPPIAGASQPRSPQARAVRSAGGWSQWQAAHQTSALQRLAFAACFTGLGALCDDLGVTPAQILFGLVRRGAGGYEKVARSAALLEMSAPAVAARAVAQGWHWRDVQVAVSREPELEAL
jgi:hypothetical protein